MTTKNKQMPVAVLIAAVRCSCGCVGMSVSRKAIASLALNYEALITCQHCGRDMNIRAAGEECAVAMLPEVLPGPNTRIFIGEELEKVIHGEKH